jgi:hypothetical protein
MGQKEKKKHEGGMWRAKKKKKKKKKEEGRELVSGRNNGKERNRCNHTQGNNNEIFEISLPPVPPNPPPLFSLLTPISQLRR